VELPLDAAFIYPPLFTPQALAFMNHWAQEHSFGYAVHLPFMWLDLSSINEEMRQASVNSILGAMDKGRALDPLAYCLHLFGEVADGIVTSGWEPEEKQAFIRRMIEQARQSLREITPTVAPHIICLENSERMPCTPILALAKETGTSLCLDVGHLALQGGDPVGFIEEHFDLIRVIHLHDVTRLELGAKAAILNDHQPLGSGIIDVAGILKSLRASNYQGLGVVEMMRRHHLVQSLSTLEALLG